MLKDSILFRIKRSKYIFKAIYLIGNIFFFIVKFFVPISQKKILFVSFGGKKFDDSPKEIFEKMLGDERYRDYEFYIGLNDLSSFSADDKRVKLIQMDTPWYFYNVMSSKIWITNSSVERSFVSIKRKSNIYVNTWHGTPLKKMGLDLPSNNKAFRVKAKMKCDIFLAQSNYEIEIFSRAFSIQKDKFKKIGLPRNDELGKMKLEQKNYIRESLSIPADKIIILYAPTYREFDKKSKIELDWIDNLDSKYFVLVRAHYEVTSRVKFDQRKNILDVGKYSNLNELVEISDMLITDYSSIFFDYSITNKKIVLYCYDYDIYTKERGLYFDPRKYFDNYDNEKDLVNYLNNRKLSEPMNEIEEFSNNFIEESGNSSMKLLRILENLEKENKL
jgi:CDP-glycerol glycerophosphotransferase